MTEELQAKRDEFARIYSNDFINKLDEELAEHAYSMGFNACRALMKVDHEREVGELKKEIERLSKSMGIVESGSCRA